MIVDALVEPQPANDAQTRAVRAAARGDRFGQLDGFADRRLQVQLVVIRQTRRLGLIVGRQRPTRGEVKRREELLLEPEVHDENDLAKAPTALEIERGPKLRGGEDAAIRSDQPDTAGDRLGQGQVVTEADGDVAELVDAVRAGARLSVSTIDGAGVS